MNPHFFTAPSTQQSVWQLCKALLRIVIGSEAVGSLPHSYASKCAGRETKARNYMPYEQPPWRRESRRGTSEFGFIQRGA